MFQLKMYMASSGRAPKRGSRCIEGSLHPHPAPACPGSQSCSCFTSYIFEQEEDSPGLPSHATFEGWNTDQWDGMVQSSLSGTRGNYPLHLPPHTLPSVGGSGRRGAGCQFHFLTPFCDNSFYFLYLSGNGVVGAKYEA